MYFEILAAEIAENQEFIEEKRCWYLSLDYMGRQFDDINTNRSTICWTYLSPMWKAQYNLYWPSPILKYIGLFGMMCGCFSSKRNREKTNGKTLCERKKPKIQAPV